MAFSFKRSENPTEGLRRIAIEQVDAALREIDSERLKPDKKVHQVRKRCKKLRGLARLARPGAPEVYRTENAWIRDTAATLSVLRDSETVLTTLDKLLQRYSDQVQPAAFDSLRRSLSRRKQQLAGDRSDVERTLQAAGERLSVMAARVPQWELKPNKFATLVKGLASYYEDGRDAMKQAMKEPTPETLHQWRKRVKDYWYHSELLVNVWPEMISVQSKLLHRLSEWLGDEHDLAVLLEQAGEDSTAFDSQEDFQAFTELVNQRRRTLQRKSFATGRRLYAEKPSQFADRWKQYFRIWRAEPTTQPPAEGA